ncbi:MAG: hypothetical protein IKZ91_04175 [Bacteroidales bacterium]|nr:hypothetical protein [Bacteroidales bacterium]
MVTICTINPDGANAPVTSLQAYIEHKIGSPLEAIDADSHERFLVIEAEALRDIIVMAEVTGTGARIELCPLTQNNPDCVRLIRRHCRTI